MISTGGEENRFDASMQHFTTMRARLAVRAPQMRVAQGLRPRDNPAV